MAEKLHFIATNPGIELAVACGIAWVTTHSFAWSVIVFLFTLACGLYWKKEA